MDFQAGLDLISSGNGVNAAIALGALLITALIGGRLMGPIGIKLVGILGALYLGARAMGLESVISGQYSEYITIGAWPLMIGSVVAFVLCCWRFLAVSTALGFWVILIMGLGASVDIPQFDIGRTAGSLQKIVPEKLSFSENLSAENLRGKIASLISAASERVEPVGDFNLGKIRAGVKNISLSFDDGWLKEAAKLEYADEYVRDAFSGSEDLARFDRSVKRKDWTLL